MERLNDRLQQVPIAELTMLESFEKYLENDEALEKITRELDKEFKDTWRTMQVKHREICELRGKLSCVQEAFKQVCIENLEAVGKWQGAVEELTLPEAICSSLEVRQKLVARMTAECLESEWNESLLMLKEAVKSSDIDTAQQLMMSLESRSLDEAKREALKMQKRDLVAMIKAQMK